MWKADVLYDCNYMTFWKRPKKIYMDTIERSLIFRGWGEEDK